MNESGSGRAIVQSSPSSASPALHDLPLLLLFLLLLLLLPFANFAPSSSVIGRCGRISHAARPARNEAVQCVSHAGAFGERTHVAPGRLTRYTRERGSINGGCREEWLPSQAEVESDSAGTAGAVGYVGRRHLRLPAEDVFRPRRYPRKRN